MGIEPDRAPITDSDDVIAAALKDVSIPALIMSMVHITGDPAWIRGDDIPAGSYLNETQGFMEPDVQDRVRSAALEAIAAFRDAGSELPTPPSGELVHEMMNVLVADTVPQEYVPMMLEELELDGVDRRAVDLSSIPAEERADTHVVVIGAGMSGVLAGIRLGEAGISYTVVEKNSAIGGTWFENRYPGCRVDVGNHFYCYSFEPNNEWSEFFSQQPELQRYFEDAAKRHDVLSHIVFESEVTSAMWDEAKSVWSVETKDSDGLLTKIEATAVISAVGQLNRPKLPDIDGIETFEGEAMHSAQWQADTDLVGKRVAVIGSGASAFQIVPTIAGEVENLSVFQRSAPWMFPNPHYHDAVGDGVKWALENLPYYGRWFRFLIFWPACDGGMIAMKVDPEWPHQDRAVSEANDLAREFFTGWILDQVGDRPDLAKKVVPDYVCLGKRTLQDNGSWLQALTRQNVDLVTDPIVEVIPKGVRTRSESGDLVDHEVDVLIYATGFHANKYLWPMRIVGRDGSVLSDQWGDEPTAHLGITVPNFPNLFCLYGPGTNLASGGSLVFHSECQVRYVMGCLKMLLESSSGELEVRSAAHDEYNKNLQEEMDLTVWAHDSIKSSWYQNESGRIYILSPWRLVDYWSWTREPEPSDFRAPSP